MAGIAGVLHNGRATTERLLFDGLCYTFGRVDRDTGEREARILSGPLKGMRLALLKTPRPSYILGRYEPELQAAMAADLPTGGVAYDVGSHIGYAALALSQAAGSSGRVFAFEIDSASIDTLRANVASNAPDSVEVVERAVDAVSGHVEFVSYDCELVSQIAVEGDPTDGTVTRVESVSLDDFVYRDGNPPADVMKIAVTANEANIVKGAARLMREHGPVIYCLTEPESRAHVLEIIAEHGGYEHTGSIGEQPQEYLRLAPKS